MKVHNFNFRRRCGLQRSLSERGAAADLRWFRHTIERIMEGEISKKDLSSRGGRQQGRGRPMRM